MSAICPNPACGYHLKLTDWRANCPKCGVNILYYNMEERLQGDADNAEVEHARFQKHFDRLKAALVGSKLLITRLVLLFLPIGALFLPLAKVTANLPFFTRENADVSILGVVNLFSSFDFGSWLENIGGGILQKPSLALLLCLCGLILVAVGIIGAIVIVFFTASLKLQKQLPIFPAIGIGGVLLWLLGILFFNKEVSRLFVGNVTAHLGIGLALLAVSLAAIAIVNYLITKRGGVEVKYKECEIAGRPADEVLAVMEAENLTVKQYREKYPVQEA
ncbi:MAG: hypothetical protein LBR73_00095 [Oscillospiraceae bacterium]|jgi:hypothetical protein|nr:hypothetical protein [Oscillospiraceae bacterium]